MELQELTISEKLRVFAAANVLKRRPSEIQRQDYMRRVMEGLCGEGDIL